MWGQFLLGVERGDLLPGLFRAPWFGRLGGRTRLGGRQGASFGRLDQNTSDSEPTDQLFFG